MRELFSGKTACKSGCKYCFAKWEKEYTGQYLFELENLNLDDSTTILYPCCDSEIIDNSDFIDAAKKFAASKKQVFFSISTKNYCSKFMLDNLAKLNEYLLTKQKGYVKFAVSFSNKSHIETLEPNTLSYDNRIKLINEVKNLGIFCAVTLKPILPFIEDSEYISIVDDVHQFTNYLLLGGLYIDKESLFFDDYIMGKYKIVDRQVNWLRKRPFWKYVGSEEKIKKIAFYAKSKNMLVYHSDVDLIKSAAHILLED